MCVVYCVAMDEAKEVQVSTNLLSTKSEVKKIDYRWEISNFADQVSEDWQSIQGPVLHGCDSRMYWQLRMEPDVHGYLSVCISECQKIRRYDSRFEEVNSDLQISLGLCVLDANNKNALGNTKMPSYFKMLGTGLMWKLVKKEVILENPQRFLPDGKLTVLCTLHWLDTETFAGDRQKAPLPVVPPSDTVSWMENVLNEGLFSDVVVVAGDREFTAHRAILAERSEVFRTMFAVDMTEKRSGRIVIEDLSSDAVSDLLFFIYTDTVEDIGDNASELLVAAEKYNIPRLKEVCELELAESINVDNAVDIFVQSELYRANQLKEAALFWIARHANEVVKTTAWKSFTEEHPELVAVVCKQFASYIGQLKD